jgi:hypothetical protein
MERRQQIRQGDLDRRLGERRRERLAIATAELMAERRKAARRAVIAERIESAKFNYALARWHAARESVNA